MTLVIKPKRMVKHNGNGKKSQPRKPAHKPTIEAYINNPNDFYAWNNEFAHRTYQHLYRETTVSDLCWTKLDSEHFAKEDKSYYEYYLRDRLAEITWRLAEENLTELQLFCMKGVAEGRSQWNIADELGRNQSTVAKCLRGNVDCRNHKRYGGIFIKLRRLLDKDPEACGLFKLLQAI